MGNNLSYHWPSGGVCHLFALRTATDHLQLTSSVILPGLWRRIALVLQKTIIDDPRKDTSRPTVDLDVTWEVVAKTFEQFNLHPSRTMTVMQRARAYASGSTVLSAIDTDGFPCGDLDLYCPPDGSIMLKDYLLESGDRTMWKAVDLNEVDREDQSEDGSGSEYLRMSGIAKIWYFRDGRGKEINVIVTTTK
jgi:hypothetical protein